MKMSNDAEDDSLSRYPMSLRVAINVLDVISIGLVVMTFIEAYVKTNSIMTACLLGIASFALPVMIILFTLINEKYFNEVGKAADDHIYDVVIRRLDIGCVVQLVFLALVKFVFFA